MRELIKITEQNGKQAVSARELHAFLENKTRFNDWITRRIEEYGFIENQDYEVLLNFEKNPNGGRPLNEYALSIDCAKEISMVEGNAKGKQARQYFIACEKKLKAALSPSISYAESLRQLADSIEENERLALENEHKQQKLDESKMWYSIKRYAKENHINWRRINWRSLKAISSEHGYDIKKIFDANYGEVNLYHINVFGLLYK